MSQASEIDAAITSTRSARKRCTTSRWWIPSKKRVTGPFSVEAIPAPVCYAH